MDGESSHKRASTGTLGQGPGEMGELIDTPAGAEKLKGMRPTRATPIAGWFTLW